MLAGAEDADRKQSSPEGEDARGVPEGFGGCCCSPGSALSSRGVGHIIIALVLNVLRETCPEIGGAGQVRGMSGCFTWRMWELRFSQGIPSYSLVPRRCLWLGNCLLAIDETWTDFPMCRSFLRAEAASVRILELLFFPTHCPERPVFPKIPEFQAGWIFQSVVNAVTASLEVQSLE